MIPSGSPVKKLIFRCEFKSRPLLLLVDQNANYSKCHKILKNKPSVSTWIRLHKICIVLKMHFSLNYYYLHTNSYILILHKQMICQNKTLKPFVFLVMMVYYLLMGNFIYLVVCWMGSIHAAAIDWQIWDEKWIHSQEKFWKKVWIPLYMQLHQQQHAST